METHMDTAEFWNIIERVRGLDDPTEGLTEALRARSVEELAQFDREFRLARNRAYSWDLWGAGYIAEGGMSDDGFEYFQVWLIMQGRQTFEQVVADPDGLAGVPAPGGYELEGPQYVAASLYAERTGGGWPDHDLSLPDLGEGWDFDDEEEMVRRYPRLTAQFDDW